MPVLSNSYRGLKNLPNDVALNYICDGLIVGIIFAICLFAFFWWDDHKNKG